MSQKGIHRLISIIFIGFVLSISVSCRKDLEWETSSAPLGFSQDTVFLDTIYTQSNSETYLLKVYNRSDDDISLSQIYLNKRVNSSFRINVDGSPGFEFSEVPLRAKDSLMIFVEAAAADSDIDFIEEDELIFTDSNQEVKLLAMVENAKYYYPVNGENSFYLDNNLELDNAVSHVIYGTAKVAENQTLNISEGAKIYFHNDSGLEIENGANLNMMGTYENPIVIRGDRQDAKYDSLPKQWNEVKLKNANLTMNHVIIKGGTNGLNLENSSADIKNTQIYNMSYSGIFGKNANIYGENIAISAAAGACLNIEEGGDYEFYYSTFANLWPRTPVGINGSMVPAYLSNFTTTIDEDENENITTANFSGFFANCIFYGEYSNGVYFDIDDSAGFSYTFDACLFKNEDTNTFNYASDNNISNPQFGNPFFVSTLLSQQDLRIQSDSESAALQNANPLYNSAVPTDIINLNRANTPTIGAYENP